MRLDEYEGNILIPNIFLTGFSGSGKTSVGREVARRLGWRYVDTDDEIVTAAGKSIEAIFRDDSEIKFRELEHDCLARVCRGGRQVVSTGGGTVTQERNRMLMERSGITVCLEARPDVIYKRLQKQRHEGRKQTVRPMLDYPDPLGRIVTLKTERQVNYSLADWTVHTDRITIVETANEVVRAWEMLTGRLDVDSDGRFDDQIITVRTSSGGYPVWVGWGTLGELGERVRQLMSPGAAYVITDEKVQQHARRAQGSLERAGIPAHLFILPSGEQTKTLETAGRIYEWFASRRVERNHLLVAVGGGMVTDLAGFVAATFIRGILFGQVPTSLLCMMDASIGGKTGVDLPQGKNMVGAFYQPRFVLADTQTLKTLPDRELTSGWAEAIKHCLILDEDFLRVFEEKSDVVMSLERKVTTEVIQRSMKIKAEVVARDERETLGERVLLNYGHTIGHAIEAATGYHRILHGEAISVGMMGAAFISNELGLLSDSEVERQRVVLEAFNLPVSLDGIDVLAVKEAMSADKKTEDGAIRWVLLDGIGHAVTRDDVSPELVERALASVCK